MGGGRKTINSTENTRTGLAEAPPSNRLRSAAFSPFFKRRRGEKKRRKKSPVPGLGGVVSGGVGGERGGNEGGAVTGTPRRTGAGLNESLEINTIPPRVHRTVDNFVFLPCP